MRLIENLKYDLGIHAILENHFGMIKADLWLFERINKRAAEAAAQGETNGYNHVQLEGRHGENNA
jgi:hypothetical protein